jgi:hypothetical protein
MSHDQLESELRQLRSLDAETGLMEEVMAMRRVTRRFARGHANYLRQAAHELVQELAQAKPEPGDATALARAHADAVRLEERFVALLLRLR